MLTGSRLGAAFVVLVTAVIFAARAPDGERKAPITCAMFALFATAMIYIPAAFLGAGAAPLGHVPLDRASGHPAAFIDLIDLAYGGLVDRAEDYSPGARLPRRARLPAAGVQADRHGAADARRQHRAVVSRGLADPEVADVLPRLARRPDHDVDLGRADGARPARRQALREGRQRAALHPRREHHHARRHDARRVRARLALRGPDRARRGDRDERAQPHPPDLLLRADPQGDVASPGPRARRARRRLAAFTVRALPAAGHDHRRLRDPSASCCK